MPVHFCSHCGTKLQPDFKFCPSCGMKLPVDTEPESHTSAVCTDNKQDDMKKVEPCSAQIHSPVKMTRRSIRGVRSSPKTTPSSGQKVLESPRKHKVQEESEETLTSPVNQSVLESPRKRKVIVQEKSEITRTSPADQSVLESPRKRKVIVQEKSEMTRTSPAAKGKTAKAMGMIEPLQEGLELNDQSGEKWKLLKLLDQSENEVSYEVLLSGSDPSCLDQKYILRLAAKDGQIFTEQNFIQRAAKTVTVEKWVKRLKLDYLGMPTCLGFGLHETYRFLVFEDMGQSLNSIIQRKTKPLSLKVVLQIACRILDVLEYVHANEYTHGNLHAETVYISSGSHPKVTLSGFGRAFRFCPGGKHVEYREGCKAPHLGHPDFISLDVHLGTPPSRRSDLQSLGYCLIHWLTGALPWSSTTHKPNSIAAEKQRCLKDLSSLLRHCFGAKKVPGALQGYLSEVMDLQYSDTPDYAQLKAGLRNGLQEMGATLEDPLDL